jgi:hypothetical protein
MISIFNLLAHKRNQLDPFCAELFPLHADRKHGTGDQFQPEESGQRMDSRALNHFGQHCLMHT